MTKTIEIDPDEMVAIVRKMDSMYRKKKWVMAVFEIIKRNLVKIRILYWITHHRHPGSKNL